MRNRFGQGIITLGHLKAAKPDGLKRLAKSLGIDVASDDLPGDVFAAISVPRERSEEERIAYQEMWESLSKKLDTLYSNGTV